MNSGKCGACVAGGSQLDAEATVFYGNTLPNVAVLADGRCELRSCTVERGKSHGIVVKRGGACAIDEATVVRDNADTSVSREV